MDSDTWVCTFVQRRGDTRPMPHLVRALLKYAGRYLGLRCVADLPLRRQEMERCCRLLCEDCARLVPVKLDDNGVWWHPNKGTRCAARALRIADAADTANRRAMDAGSMDAGRRCNRCRMLLSEVDMIDLELCFPCFVEKPPCLTCGDKGYIMRRGRNRIGVPIRHAMACPMCCA